MRSLYTGLLLAATILASAGCAGQVASWRSTLDRGHPLVGVWWSAVQRRVVSYADVIAASRRATFVLLGEKHDNADHHLMQARMVADLAAERPTTVVVEMLRPEQQAALDLFYLSRPRGDAAALGDALGWKTSGWPAWPLYEPIVKAALTAGAPLRVGDVAKATLRAVGKSGYEALRAGEAARLGLDVPLPEPARAHLELELRDAHCGMMGAAAVARMYPVERLRDASLTDALLRASHDRRAHSSRSTEPHKSPTSAPRPGAMGTPTSAAGSTGVEHAVVLIAGNGHTRRDWAVPTYLARRAPEATVISLALLEVRAGVVDPAAYAPQVTGLPPYDYLWFAPRNDDVDPCVGLRETMKRVRARGVRTP